MLQAYASWQRQCTEACCMRCPQVREPGLAISEIGAFQLLLRSANLAELTQLKIMLSHRCKVSVRSKVLETSPYICCVTQNQLVPILPTCELAKQHCNPLT